MNRILHLQIHDGQGDRVAAFAYEEDACKFIAGMDGYTIRYMRETVWSEGRERFSAGESYDAAARLIMDRVTGVHITKHLSRIQQSAVRFTL